MWWCGRLMSYGKSLFCQWNTEVRWNNSTFSMSTILTIFATERTRSLIQHRGQRLRLTRASAGSGHHSLFSSRAPLPPPFLSSPSQWLANGGTAQNTYAAAASLLWASEEIAVSASAPESVSGYSKFTNSRPAHLNAEHYVNKLIPFHAVNIPSCV